MTNNRGWGTVCRKQCIENSVLKTAFEDRVQKTRSLEDSVQKTALGRLKCRGDQSFRRSSKGEKFSVFVSMDVSLGTTYDWGVFSENIKDVSTRQAFEQV